MMKKNLKDNNVVRAMALGIAAMMALGEPMTVFAEETEPATDDNTIELTEESTVEQKSVVAEAKDAADAVDTAVAKADASTELVKEDIEENVVATDVLDELKDDAEISTVEPETEEEPTTIDEAMADVDDQLVIAETSDSVAEKSLADAEAAADKAEVAAKEADEAMDAAQTEVAEDLENIENATTIEDANAAYAEMEAAVEQAQKDFDEKVAEYNDAKSAYDTAAANAEAAKTAYDNAVATAEGDVVAAEAALVAAQTEATELATKVAAAKAAVDTASAAAMDIAAKEDLTQGDSGLNWKNQDELFISIMANYYLPKEGITGATVTRVQGADNDSMNYFKAEYTDANGEPQVAYYNYKMDGNSKDKIVIFEKREVEVKGGAVDQYVDADGNKWIVNDEVVAEEGDKTLEAALADGSVVGIMDGENTTYYEKNEVTASETKVESSEITSTSTTDVAVDENSKQETYKIDETTGKLVKEVTADVTTITYTGATFTSDEEYATVAERDAAAAAKEKELEGATGKDATVENTEETTYTYTATGTYIPTFTDTITVKNKEVEKGWTIFDEANSKSEAVDYVYDGIVDDYKDDEDYYYISDSSTLAVSGYTKEEKNWIGITTDDSDYLVSGSVSVTYAKVTKKTVDANSWGAMWDDLLSLFGSESANEKLEETAKQVIEAAGGLFVSAKWADGDWNKATIRYVAGVAVENVEEKNSASDAQNATKTAAEAQAKKDGASGVMNVKVAEAQEIATTTYSYKVDYLVEETNITENVVVATENYDNAEVLTGEIIQNLNYVNGIIKLTQDNEDYREFVDSAKNLTAKYDRLLEEANTAKSDVEAAQAAVVALQAEIEKLKDKGADMSQLEDLEAQLAAAEVQLGDAEEKMDGLNGQLEEAAGVLEDVIEALTPVEDDVEDIDEDEDEEEEDEEEAVVIEEELVPLAAPAQVVVQEVVAPVEPAQPVVEPVQPAEPEAPAVVIEEEQVPLADAAVTEEKPAEEKQDETVTIEDEEVALANGEAKEKMSWWWLLVVVLLGATGYEMYRRHQAKKAEDAE